MGTECVLLGSRSLAVEVAVGTGWAPGCVPGTGHLPDTEWSVAGGEA